MDLREKKVFDSKKRQFCTIDVRWLGANDGSVSMI